MRIALITTNLGGGGAQRGVITLASILEQRGHELHLILFDHIVDYPLGPGIQLHPLSPPGKSRSHGVVGMQLTAFRLRQLFNKLTRNETFDLVISTLPYADRVVSCAGLPRVWFWIANTLSQQIKRRAKEDSRQDKHLRRRYRRLYAGQNLVAVSEGVRKDLVDELGLSDSNVIRIGYPFDFDAIRRQSQEKVDGFPEDPYTIHVGRFAAQKRHDLLLDTWCALPDAGRLVLLTRSDPSLEQMIAERGLQGRVQIAGFQPNPYPWIRKARLQVLCSDHEGLPNVLVEALVCGTPIVATDCPSGPKEILTGPLAPFLVPMGDVTALGRAITEALRDPPSLTDLDLTRFEGGKVAEQYEQLPGQWQDGTT